MNTNLDALLKRVSRSFYLSLAILPASLRTQLKAAYLVARAADTIADTRILPAPRRLELLAALKAALPAGAEHRGLQGELAAAMKGLSAHEIGSEAERVLLADLSLCLQVLHRFDEADHARAQRVLGTLIVGMERDLKRFPNAQPGDSPPVPVALATLADLDEHTYFAAGCVGEYWTLMCAAHVQGLHRLSRPDYLARGVRLGKALQLVNVLRDIPADLQEGRCYIPEELLQRAGLRANDLTDSSLRLRVRPLFEEIRQRALAHIDAAFPYVLAIPATQARLRLAALWPLWIALGTLGRLRDAADPLDPKQRIKITRQELYQLVAESVAVVAVDRWLIARHRARRISAS